MLHRIACVSGLLTCLLGVAAAGEPPVTFDAEPSYESACANWAPVQYACTVLAAKNSRAKFVSSFRGGVHTVYVSEVLGHCPLLPGHSDLMAFIPEGIQVLFVAGEPPDFRTAPRPDIRQRLARGYLPIVETTWEDPAEPFRYEELAFVRLIGSETDPGLDVARGDENAAAFLRLRVENLSLADRTARLRLCINGSNNGQPRGVSALEYGAALSARGNRAFTAEGRLRLLWRAPEGAKVEPRLRDAVPRVLEWRAGEAAPIECPARAELPFNRYFATRGNERHDAFKAFDRLGMTYWTPQAPLQGSAVGIGLEFPEKRWICQLSLRFEGDQSPAVGGYRLEAFDGAAWSGIPHRLNGKPADELQGSPEAQKALGAVWTFTFEPLQATGLRLMVDRMPEGKDRPAVAEASYSYSLDADAAGGAARWFDAASDYLSNFVSFEVPVRARSRADVLVLVPFVPAGPEEGAWLEGRDFDRELAAATAWWESVVRSAARFEVPERVVGEVWNANVPHILTTSEIDPTNGLAITKTNAGWYEAVWPSLSAAAILGLDLAGHHEDAARYLEPFLKWQGTIDPPGKFTSREGFLAAADDYTWVRWSSNHGWLLWALCEHYLLSGDRKWLDRALPNILAACDWIERERAAGKVDAAAGTRPPHWGLLPPGPTGDGAPTSYGFFGEACAWRGLDAAAAVLREIGHARAGELTSASREHRECIESALRRAVDLAKPYRLRSGGQVPFVPMDLYNTWKINTGDPTFDRHPWYLDVGPLHAVDLGAIDARSDLAGWMVQIAEDHWLKNHLALDEPWYAPHRAVYYGRDDIQSFLGLYYNLLAEGMDRQVYAPVEGHGGVQNLPWGDGEHMRFLRMMLVQEAGDSLHLERAVPRAWLIQGRRIAVREAPTHFGRVSYSLQSNVLGGTIAASIVPPDRKPVPLHLRLRHPQGAAIRGVTVNGRAHEDFEGEWIRLPAGSERLEVVASY